VVGLGNAAEGGDDGVVDAADADGGVAEVDEGVAGDVQRREGGAQGHGFPGADFPSDDAEGVLADAPADPGGGLGVGGVAVQHARGQVAAERHLGESVFSELVMILLESLLVLQMGAHGRGCGLQVDVSDGAAGVGGQMGAQELGGEVPVAGL
jgi:hypothetical protein